MNDKNAGQAQTQDWRVSPLRRVLTEAAEAYSFWERVRLNDFVAPMEARDLLAMWAHLQRFPDHVGDERLNTRATSIRAQLQNVVERDWEQLVRQMLRCRCDAWLAHAKAFDAGWEDLLRSPDSLALDCRAWELFTDLDRYSLASYAAIRLLDEAIKRDSANEQRVRQYGDDLKALQRHVQVGEEFLRSHPDAFLPGAPLVESYLLEYRPDLDEVDWDLWMTTLKHGVLEERLREANEPVLPTLLDETELGSIRSVVRRILSEPQSRKPRPPAAASRQEEQIFTMAAESTRPNVASSDWGMDGPIQSIYKLRDRQGRIVELRTDRNGHVFAVLPPDAFVAVPKGILINTETYVVTVSQLPLIEIVELREGDLRELADGEYIVQGDWQL